MIVKFGHAENLLKKKETKKTNHKSPKYSKYIVKPLQNLMALGIRYELQICTTCMQANANSEDSQSMNQFYITQKSISSTKVVLAK